MSDQYDAIVIGAGLGGLSSALSLSQKGLRVLLLEQHNVPGGCASSFRRGRFEFEAALHEFCAFGTKDNLGYAGDLLVNEYGIDVDVRPCPDLFRAIFTARSGKYYDVRLDYGEEGFKSSLLTAVPGCEKAIDQFLSLCKESYEVSSYFDRHMFDKKKRNGDVKISAFHFAKHYLRYLQVAEVPFNTVLRKIGMPEDAIDILDCYRVYLGMDPEEESFTRMSTMIYSYIVYKPAVIAPNSHALSSAMLARFKELGGTAYFGVKANEITADENGHITGVDTDYGHFTSQQVIANSYPNVVYSKLLSKNVKVPAREKKRTHLAKISSRFLNVYLGLNRSAKELGIEDYTLFFPGDLRQKRSGKTPLDYHDIAATAYNLAIPEISPEGTSILTLTLEYKDDVWGSVSEEDYFRLKEEVTKKAIADYEATTGIVITPYIEEVEIATPWTFSRYLSSPEGAVYGLRFDRTNTILSMLIGLRRDQPIPGLKITGASGPRGDGFSQTIVCGHDIAELTYEEIQSRRKKHGKQ